MDSFFIPHKLKSGDIAHLSDKDSEFVISQKLFKTEDLIEITTLEGVFWGRITNIAKSSVEVEILKKISDTEIPKNDFSITVIQSISNDLKFNFFLEKCVEIGVHRIIPIESRYSLIPKKKAVKKYETWKKIIQDAKEQSRNPFDIDIEKPINIKNLKKPKTKYTLCFATEVKKSLSLKNTLTQKEPQKSYTIAIGPERGWSISDLEIFKKLGFEFIKLDGNILRTETTALVISSILNFRANKY